MVACVLEIKNGIVQAARVAVGSCSPVALRLPALERALAGHALNRDLATIPKTEHLTGLSPIDDVRGSAEYRKDAALTLIRRSLERLS